MKLSKHAGVSMISVLVAILLFSFGLLGISGAYARLVGVTSQNQNLTQMASWGNGFWGVVQANPDVLTTLAGASPVIFVSTTVGNAPAALQPWLQQVVNPAVSTTALAGSTVTITTGPDAALNTACTATTGCSVRLQIAWPQVGGDTVGGAAVSRSQTFNYQFGF